METKPPCTWTWGKEIGSFTERLGRKRERESEWVNAIVRITEMLLLGNIETNSGKAYGFTMESFRVFSGFSESGSANVGPADQGENEGLMNHQPHRVEAPQNIE